MSQDQRCHISFVAPTHAIQQSHNQLPLLHARCNDLQLLAGASVTASLVQHIEPSNLASLPAKPGRVAEQPDPPRSEDNVAGALVQSRKVPAHSALCKRAAPRGGLGRRRVPATGQ